MKMWFLLEPLMEPQDVLTNIRLLIAATVTKALTNLHSGQVLKLSITRSKPNFPGKIFLRLRVAVLLSLEEYKSQKLQFRKELRMMPTRRIHRISGMVRELSRLTLVGRRVP